MDRVIISVGTALVLAGHLAGVPQLVAQIDPLLVVGTIRHPDDSIEITLQNKAAKDVVGWTLEVTCTFDDGSVDKAEFTQDRLPAEVRKTLGRPLSPTIPTAIEPAGLATDRVPVPAGTTCTEPSVLLTVFDDATSSGDSSYRERFFGHREARAAAIDRWLPVLADAESRPDEASGIALLAKALADSAAASAPMPGDQWMQREVGQILNQARSRPGLLAAVIGDQLEILKALRTASRRHIR